MTAYPTKGRTVLDREGQVWVVELVGETFATLAHRSKRRRYVPLREWPPAWVRRA